MTITTSVNTATSLTAAQTTANRVRVAVCRNSTYLRFYGPDAATDRCPACRAELEQLGPEHGPVRPDRPGVWAWSMSPEEWAGGGIAVQNSPF
ncbi:hypothetical protein MAHJHV61_00420 [Mycobacterium avium subsp. hominissuis]